jgi:hypothetical protein
MVMFVGGLGAGLLVYAASFIVFDLVLPWPFVFG